MNDPGGEWLTVAQCAARLGVSEKTVLRRIRRGELTAEKVSLASGGFGWHVAPDTPGQDTPGQPHSQAPGQDRDNGTAQGTSTGAKQQNTSAPRVEPSGQATGQADTPGQDRDRTPGQSAGTSEVERLRLDLERERAESQERERFYRAQIEAANRTAAEATAAVRELTRALNTLKALPAPDSEPAQGNATAPPGTPIAAPASDNAPDVQRPVRVQRTRRPSFVEWILGIGKR